MRRFVLGTVKKYNHSADGQAPYRGCRRGTTGKTGMWIPCPQKLSQMGWESGSSRVRVWRESGETAALLARAIISSCICNFQASLWPESPSGTEGWPKGSGCIANPLRDDGQLLNPPELGVSLWRVRSISEASTGVIWANLCREKLCDSEISLCHSSCLPHFPSLVSSRLSPLS